MRLFPLLLGEGQGEGLAKDTVFISRPLMKKKGSGARPSPQPSPKGSDILGASRMLNPATIYATHSEDLSPFSLWEKGRG